MSSKFSLEGSSALITGAGSGIGRSIAVAFAASGCRRLFVVGRTGEKLNKTKELVFQQASDCAVHETACDITDAEQRRKLIDTVTSNTGPLDILVNSAGMFEGVPAGDTTDELWSETFCVNVAAPFALIRDLKPLLLTSKQASVINISSTLAQKPIPNAAAYNASKAALDQLTRSLALEFGPEGIRVNSILPAVVKTPMYRGRFATEAEFESMLESMGRMHPLGRVGVPEDIASAAVFLASPAAAWITGVTLPVDGGMLCT